MTRPQRPNPRSQLQPPKPQRRPIQQLPLLRQPHRHLRPPRQHRSRRLRRRRHQGRHRSAPRPRLPQHNASRRPPTPWSLQQKAARFPRFRARSSRLPRHLRWSRRPPSRAASSRVLARALMARRLRTRHLRSRPIRLREPRRLLPVRARRCRRRASRCCRLRVGPSPCRPPASRFLLLLDLRVPPRQLVRAPVRVAVAVATTVLVAVVRVLVAGPVEARVLVAPVAQVAVADLRVVPAVVGVVAIKKNCNRKPRSTRRPTYQYQMAKWSSSAVCPRRSSVPS